MEPEAHSATQQELEDLYSSKNRAVNDKIYGTGWTSPGGYAAAREFSLKLGLRPGQKVLEIGSGLGGAAFYLAFQYGAHVQGVDYSSTMVQLANQRLSKQDAKVIDKVTFTLGNILEMEFPPNSFDAVYSREVILHMEDKETLFKKIKDWLKPGGKILFTDICRGDSEHLSEGCRNYILYYKCSMIKLKDYEDLIRNSDLDLLEATDISEKFIEICEDELKHFVAAKEATVQEVGQKAYDEIELKWNVKIKSAASKEIIWGIFLASA